VEKTKLATSSWLAIKFFCLLAEVAPDQTPLSHIIGTNDGFLPTKGHISNKN
jgi:hypothetical protein